MDNERCRFRLTPEIVDTIEVLAASPLPRGTLGLAELGRARLLDVVSVPGPPAEGFEDPAC
jgi:hypothetical protein